MVEQEKVESGEVRPQQENTARPNPQSSQLPPGTTADNVTTLGLKHSCFNCLFGIRQGGKRLEKFSILLVDTLDCFKLQYQDSLSEGPDGPNQPHRTTMDKLKVSPCVPCVLAENLNALQRLQPTAKTYCIYHTNMKQSSVACHFTPLQLRRVKKYIAIEYVKMIR